MSQFPKICFIALYVWISLLNVTKLPAQTLVYYGNIIDGVGAVDGLDGGYGVTVSPDDIHVYACSSTDDAITAFSRNSVSGDLTFIEVHFDDSKVGGTIDGLLDAKRLCISPDGKHIYAPSYGDDALVVFSRNATTGALTYVETHKDGVGGLDSLDGAYQAHVSPDNKHVYVAANTDDAISVFSRNTTTGALTFVQAIQNGTMGITSLNSIREVKVSPDGNHVYGASSISDAISVFSRNATTGQLTFVEAQTNGVGGVGGLNNAYGVFISPDNKHIYSISANDDAVSVFSRNLTTGALTYIETHSDDSQGGSVLNLDAGRGIIGTSNGSYILAVSSNDDALVVFSRNPVTGALTLEEEHVNGAAGVGGLNGSRAIAVSQNDESIYIVSTTDDAIAIFNFDNILSANIQNFEVQQVQSSVKLSWQISKELAIDHCTIERSTDGLYWNNIQRLSGDENNNKVQYYVAKDFPLLAGNLYYRIHASHKDGQSTYSSIRSIHMTSLLSTRIHLHPNPAQDELTVTGIPHGIKIPKIYSISGKKVNPNIKFSQINPHEVLIDLTTLDPGMYFIKIKNTTRKFIKQ